ncbi:hypothetical protein AGMMS49975_13570 [Clostridia bacterium]|nr:hypothetical protein AGMMS49975_13570 [Clostridia bacterium]
MSSIDNRIVEMVFNNRQFEDGIQTSIKSLDSLNKGLTATGHGNALSALQAGVETISERFSALGVIGVTALMNITNRAVDAGVALAKSLSVDQITAGFNKFEEKTKSTQTIMAAGYSMEEVNKQLEKLMWYADETSYSFTDMTKNVGKFAASGVDLDTAVTAMQGISNWAAISGQGTNEASRAMYNLAQSLGTGKVRLIDWKSIENANMATKEFKETVIKTAQEMGVLSADTEVTFANFSSTLEQDWFTSDVLLKSLEKYGNYSDEVYRLQQEMGFSGATETMEWMSKNMDTAFMNLGDRAFKAAQEAKTFTDAINATKDAVSSGWMITFETIVGNYEEAKSLWTSFAGYLWEIFASGDQARNEMLAAWKELGGRNDLLDSISNLYEGIKSIITPLKEAFSDIFPPMTAERLFAFTEGLKELTAKLTISDDTSDKLRRTFAGLFAILDMGGMLFSALWQGLKDLIGVFLPAGDGLLDFTAKFGDWLVGVRNAAKESDVFNVALQNIEQFIKSAIDFLAPGVDNIIIFFKGLWEGIGESIVKLQEKLGEFDIINLNPLSTFSENAKTHLEPFSIIGDMFKKVFEAIATVLEWFAPIATTLGSIIGKVFEALGETIGRLIKNLDFNILDIVNAGLFTTVIIGLKNFVYSLESITAKASGMLGSIKGVLNGVRDSLEMYQQRLKAQVLFTIASAVALLAGALIVLSTIDGDKLAVALTGITVLMSELMGSMMLFGKSIPAVKGLATATVGITAIAQMVLILSIAVRILAGLETNQLMAGVVAIGIILAEIAGFTQIFNPAKLISTGVAMIAIGAALNIIASAVKTLGGMDTTAMAQGLVAIFAILVEIAVFSRAVNPEKLISTGVAMIAMGAALKIMSSAVKSLGELDIADLVKGVIALGIVMAEIAGFTHIVNPAKLVSTGVAMIAMGAAIKIMASAVRDFGAMNIEDLAKGIIAMGVALAEIAGFTQIINPTKLISTGVAMIAMGAALLIIANAVQSFGSMSYEELAIGLIALGGALAIIAVAMTAVQTAISGAAAMLVMAAAIAILTPALMLLGTMEYDEIGKSLLMLFGAFVVVGAAALILSPLIPAILGLAAAVALLGVGTLAAGVGVTLLSAGLAALAVSGTAGAAALVIVVSSLISLIPYIFEKVGEGIIALAGVIENGVPAIMKAVEAIIIALVDVLIKLLPMIVDAGIKLLIALLKGISENIQDIVTLALEIISELLSGLANGIPRVVESAVDLIVAFLEAIGKETPRIIDAAFNMIIDFINGLADAIRENTGTLIEAVMNLADAIIDGLIDGIFAGIDGVVTMIADLCIRLWESFKEFFGIASPSKLMEDGGGNIIKGLINGVSNKLDEAVTAIKNLGKAMLAGIKGIINGVDGIKKVASNIISGLKNGLEKGLGEIGIAAKNLGNKLLNGIKDTLGINSPSKRMAEIGEYSGLGLVHGLNSMENAVSKTAGSIGDTAYLSMQKSLSNVSDMFLGDFDMTPTLRPVIDTSDIEKGLNAAFSKEQSLNIGAIKEKASALSKTSGNQNDVLTAIDAISSAVSKALNAANPPITNNLTVNNTVDSNQRMAASTRSLELIFGRGGRIWA